jgi:hypothetical protein
MRKKGKLKGKQQGIYTYEDEFTTKPCNPEQTNAETNTSKTLCFTQFQLCQRSFVYHNKAHHPYQQITLTPLGNHDAFQPYQNSCLRHQSSCLQPPIFTLSSPYRLTVSTQLPCLLLEPATFSHWVFNGLRSTDFTTGADTRTGRGDNCNGVLRNHV